MEKQKWDFKKGENVKFEYNSKNGFVTGKGTITVMPPKNPGRGQNRFTVTDATGKEWRPFVSQCFPVKSKGTTF